MQIVEWILLIVIAHLGGKNLSYDDYLKQIKACSGTTKRHI